ncbi:hypothetical protein [Latilactobacillus curvatus]|uniref:hypothetical protein n=1 Tax=Latilactobacillus curvatus TaxID=28038 RepID=UPI0039B112FC
MMEREKVKLPRPIYNVLKAQGFSIHGIKRDKGSFFPITTLWGMATVSDKSEPSEYEALTKFLYSNSENQWLLIDALRYGYEAEPEPRWGIKAGHSYLYEPNDKSFGPDEEPFSYSSRYDADQVIVKLGFGEVVDLNKVGKADE